MFFLKSTDLQGKKNMVKLRLFRHAHHDDEFPNLPNYPPSVRTPCLGSGISK